MFNKFFKTNPHTHCVINEDSNVYENLESNASFKTFYDDDEFPIKKRSSFRSKLNCIHIKSLKSNYNNNLKNSKFVQLVRKYLRNIFDSNKLNDKQLEKLAQILNPTSLDHLNQIVNSPNIDKIKSLLPLLLEKENLNQISEILLNESKLCNCSDTQQTQMINSNENLSSIRVADKIKKFNEMINLNKSQMKSEKPSLLIPSQNLVMTKFKEELTKKLEQKFSFKLPTMNSLNSDKSVSSFHLSSGETKLVDKTFKSLPLIETTKLVSNEIEIKVKDGLELNKLNKNKTKIESDNSLDELSKKEIQFNLLSRVYSLSLLNLSCNDDELYEIEFKIINTLREIYNRLEFYYENHNVPIDIESMSDRELLNEKNSLEHYLFKLDYEFGKNKFLINNQLYLKLVKRYNLIRVVLNQFKCGDCGKNFI